MPKAQHDSNSWFQAPDFVLSSAMHGSNPSISFLILGPSAMPSAMETPSRGRQARQVHSKQAYSSLSPMGREAIHNSITALNLGGNPPLRRAASPLPISRLAGNSPSPWSTDSVPKGTQDKPSRNPRRPLSPLISEAAGSLRARQATPIVYSIL